MSVSNMHEIFLEHTLPRDVKEMYQLCYVTSENKTYGISCPFQFISDRKRSDLTKIANDSIINSEYNGSTAYPRSDYSSLNFDEEIAKLKFDNKCLRENLQDVIDHMMTMQKMISLQQKEIEFLKEQNRLADIKRLQNTSNRLSDLKNISGAWECDYTNEELEPIPPFPIINYNFDYL